MLLGRSALVAAAFVVLTALGTARAGPAEEEPPPTQPPGGASGEIIPEPDTGQEPESPGERGGWLQFTVLAAMVAGIGVIGLLVWRDMRRRENR